MFWIEYLSGSVSYLKRFLARHEYAMLVYESLVRVVAVLELCGINSSA